MFNWLLFFEKQGSILMSFLHMYLFNCRKTKISQLCMNLLSKGMNLLSKGTFLSLVYGEILIFQLNLYINYQKVHSCIYRGRVWDGEAKASSDFCFFLTRLCKKAEALLRNWDASFCLTGSTSFLNTLLTYLLLTSTPLL